MKILQVTEYPSFGGDYILGISVEDDIYIEIIGETKEKVEKVADELASGWKDYVTKR